MKKNKTTTEETEAKDRTTDKEEVGGEDVWDKDLWEEMNEYNEEDFK